MEQNTHKTFARMNRKPYFWKLIGANMLLSLMYKIMEKVLDNAYAFSEGVIDGVLLLTAISTIVWIVIVVRLAIRRSHDLNKSAWFAIISFIPIASLYLVFKKGTPGPNRYGPDPLAKA